MAFVTFVIGRFFRLPLQSIRAFSQQSQVMHSEIDTKSPLPSTPGEWRLDISPPDLYRELRGLAVLYLSRERPGHTLQPTALIHEAFLRVFGSFTGPHTPQDFFARAAEAMRRVLVDHARRKTAAKRGPDPSERVARELDRAPSELPPLDVLVIDEALSKLESVDNRAAQLVRLRFFVGLTVPETAEVLGISVSAAEEDWRFARAWLSERLG